MDGEKIHHIINANILPAVPGALEIFPVNKHVLIDETKKFID